MSIDSLIHLGNVRLSFPHIAEPQKQQGDSGERVTYNAEFILTPDHPGWAKFWQVVNAKAAEKWKDKAPQVIQMVNGDRKKRCYGSGQEKVNSKTFKVYDGYEGMVYIGAQRQQKDGMPQIIDAQGQAIDPANTMACQALARKLYGGCYVNAAIKPWFQENKHGYGIRCELVAVQFFADGTPFGEGNIDASGLFQPAPAGAAVPGFAPPPGMPPMPGAVPGAPANLAWAQPQVGMPPPPFGGGQAAGMTAPTFGAPQGLPSFFS